MNDTKHPTSSSERQEWISVALGAVRKLAAAGQPFQCHDLVRIYQVPEPYSPNLWGVMMGIAHADGIVVPVAAVQSSRPKTAKSLVRLWIGAQHVDREGAA